MRQTWKRLLACFLTVVIVIGAIPAQALAYMVGSDSSVVLYDKNGNPITPDESWEERFPYGTFAFQNSEIKVGEGDKAGVMQLYRLGGTSGKATAYIQYTPVFGRISEDEYTYINAAGYGDVIIEVEDPLPITQYQAFGKDPAPKAPVAGGNVLVKMEDGMPVDETVTNGAIQMTEGDYILSLDVKADAYQWYVLGDGWQEIVTGATDSDFIVDLENYALYDFYCVYTVDGVSYGSNSAKGVIYVPEEEEVPQEVPDGLELNPEPTYSVLEMDPENPYQGYIFAMTFADGEWVKEIRISSPEDSDAEADKFGTFTIVDCDGGSLYDAANTLMVHIIDNEAPEPSQLGFVTTSVEFDKASGMAEVTVRRTGGKQNVISVDYKTQDGTAVSGLDYTETEGTLMFYGDVDEQVIEIPLINDGVESEDRVSFDVVLFNVKGGGDEALCSLIEGKEVIEVSLYNSNNSEEKNLSTILFENNAIDISGQVTEQDGSVAPVESETITGVQVIEEEDALTATIGGTAAGPQARTFTYTGEPIRFSRNSIGSYTSNYWRDYYRMTGIGYSNWDADSFGSFSLSADDSVNLGLTKYLSASEGGGIRYARDRQGRVSLNVPNFAKWYSQIYAEFGFQAALASDWDLFWHGASYTWPWAAVYGKERGNIKHYNYIDANPSIRKDGLEYILTWTSGGDIWGYSWDMNEPLFGLQLGVSQYDMDSDEESYSWMKNALLRRRTFTNDLNLTIYTANDSDSAPNGGAVLTPNSGVYASIRPKVSLVAKEGGVNSSGKLYIGSKLKIELAKTPSYSPAETADGSASFDYAVYLTDSAGNIVQRAQKADNGIYYLTMDWGGLNETGLRGQYHLNVIMTRKQSLSLDVTPSTERKTDVEGNTLSEVDPSKYGETWNRFNASGSNGNTVTVGYTDVTSTKPHFSGEKTKTVSFGSASTASQTLNNLENVQWINFNRDPEDRIIFNGRTYAGDEKIWLTMADLAVSDLRFIYYHKDYLTSESIMTTTIDQVAVYLDKNGNGQIDGYYNRETGYFVLEQGEDGTDLDEFMFFLESGVDYDESIFAPVKIGDKYCQYFFKVYYSKIPRCLVPPSGEEDARAQLIPAFISNVTDSSTYERLTEEQQSYRFIVAGKSQNAASNTSAPTGYFCSGDNLLMYGAEANRMEILDVPLGGDVNPPKMNAAKTDYTWTPEYQGNLLYSFEHPEPIFIEHSLAGDNIAIAEIDDLINGQVTYKEDGSDKINGYLGSYAGNSTIALCIREQEQTTAQIALTNGAKTWPGVLDEAVTFSMRSQQNYVDLEAVTIGKFGTFPNSEYLKKMTESGQDPQAGFDMKESGNAFSEFNVDLGTELPALDIGVTDFVTITMDGYEVGFSIGVPLAGYDSAGDAGTGGTGAQGGKESGEWFGTKKAFGSAKDDMKALKKFMQNWDREAAKGADDSYANAINKSKMVAKGFTVSIDASMAFLFKYNPMDNTYYFSQFSVMASAGFEITYQQRFTPCPLLYVYVTFGVGVEFGLGVNVERVSKTEEFELPKGADQLKAGDSIVFPTVYKGFDVKFNGKLLVELFEEESCTTPVTDGFSIGFIKSDGDDDVSVNMKQKKGYFLDEEKDTYYVLLTAIEDTSIEELALILEAESLTYFSGFSISPEVFLEVGAGFGIEIMKLEIYIKANLVIVLVLGSFDEETRSYDKFSFDELEFTLGVGFRLVLLMFSYEMDLMAYKVGFEKGGDPEWTHSISAVGGMFDKEANKDDPIKLRSRRLNQSSGVSVKLPFSTESTQMIYSGEQGGFMPFAFKPTDPDVPFELSGYGSSGDAFMLADGLTTGYEYQVITVGNQNYLIYTISRSGDDIHPVDYTMLVMSRLRLTNEDGQDKYSLVNPVDAEDSTPYILLDTKNGNDDGTGDLEFNAWVDGDKIYASWISYAEPSDIEELTTTPAIQNVASRAARSTVVKMAIFDPADEDAEGFSDAAIISGMKDGKPVTGSHTFLPNGMGEGTVVYGKSNHLTADEIRQSMETHQDYLNKAFPITHTSNDEAYEQIKEYRRTYQEALWDTYGESSVLCVAHDGKSLEIDLGDGQILENVEATEIKGETYVAYTTGQQVYMTENGKEDLANIHRLYLLKLDLSNEVTAANVTPLLLRTLIDYDQNSDNDGFYSATRQTEQYTDPYFSNLQFLQGKLGGIQGTEEEFTAKLSAADEKEIFLLFEMNGSTYVIPQKDLEGITGENHKGKIVPFFTPEKIGDQTPSSTGRAEVTIGADGAGNISAVYVGTVSGTTNNALYLTKWDPNSQTWGSGTMLAMNHMQVHEDAAERGWSYDEMEQAFLGRLTGYDNGGMDQFVFSNVQIALGQTKTQSSAVMTADETGLSSMTKTVSREGSGSSEYDNEVDPLHSSRDTLLVLTQGTLNYLTEQTYTDPEGNERTIIHPMNREDEAEAYEKAYAEASRQGKLPNKPGVGFFAISYGVGNQAIGRSNLTFTNYNFTAGSRLFASLSFINTGDVAIRASEDNPAKVTLKLYVPGTEESTGTYQDLAVWKLTESVRSGQKVSVSGFCSELTENLPVGSIFFVEMEEDQEYIESTGGTAFHATTLVMDETGAPKDGDLVVSEKAELALEDIKINSVNADTTGNTTLQVEFTATNRGNAVAGDVYVQFRYETEDGAYVILDITDSDLNVTPEEPIQMFGMRNADPKASGILYLISDQEEDDGKLRPGMMRKVTGTITVPSDVYQGSITDSLNLHLEIFSDQDTEINTYSDLNSDDVFYSDHGEYNSLNNVSLTQIEHKTFFTAADKVTMALGTTLRLPVSYTTTTGEEPLILVEEISDEQSNADGSQLGILYYEKTGTDTGMLVLTPSREGLGVIHLKDEATNTIESIPFEVLEAGSGVDIYKDNGMFSFYNANGTDYSETVPEQSWTFQENQLTWGSGEAAEAPMDYTLSVADQGSYFTFTTMAESIKLYVEGSVEVNSDFPRYIVTTYDGMGGNAPVDIVFGENSEFFAHTVTIKALEDGVRFDRMEETYSGAEPPVPSDDSTDPHIYWSRSFPETASIENGSKEVLLTCYVLDDGILTEILLNGSSPDSLVKTSDGFWQFDVKVKENGSISVAALDNAGNRTSRTVRVDWFNEVVTSGTTSDAPKLEAQFRTGLEDGSEGTEVDGYLIEGDKAYLVLTESDMTSGSEVTASRIFAYVNEDGSTELVDNDLSPAEPHAVWNQRYDATANGWYLLKLEAEDGTWSQLILEMDQVDTDIPAVTLTLKEPWTLYWTVMKSTHNHSSIAEVTINGQPVEIESGKTWIEQSYPIGYGGTYVLEVADEAGNTNSTRYTVTNSDPVDLTGAEQLITVESSWNQNRDNGKVTVDLTGVTGGLYDVETFETTGEYKGSYEFALDGEDVWYTGGTLEGLTVGEHKICVRDANDPTNEAAKVEVVFEIDDDAITFITQAINATRTGTKDGIVLGQAFGGHGESQGVYQYIIRPLEEEESELMDIRDLTTPMEDEDEEAPQWQVADLSGEDLSVGVMDGLKYGWYQVAVRTMEGVTMEELEELQALYSVVIAEQEALEEDVETSEALMAAVDAYETKLGELNDKAEAMYAADPDLWTGAYTDKVYVDYTYSTRPTHAIVPVVTEHGSFTVEPLKAKYGTTVTVIPTPDQGYVVDDVTVTSINGVELVVRAQEDGTYTFVMPSNPVHVEVTFVPEDSGDVWNNPFIDVPENAWYYEAVKFVHQNGLMSGTGADTFSPNLDTTRGMIVTILYQLEGKPEVSEATTFTDVKSTAYYAKAVAWANAAGVVAGYGDGTFGPNDRITREQMATILYNYAKYKEYDVSEQAVLDQYLDDHEISRYAMDPMQWANASGMINGVTETTLVPKGGAIRCQAAMILMKFCQKFVK